MMQIAHPGLVREHLYAHVIWIVLFLIHLAIVIMLNHRAAIITEIVRVRASVLVRNQMEEMAAVFRAPEMASAIQTRIVDLAYVPEAMLAGVWSIVPLFWENVMNPTRTVTTLFSGAAEVAVRVEDRTFQITVSGRNTLSVATNIRVGTVHIAETGSLQIQVIL